MPPCLSLQSRNHISKYFKLNNTEMKLGNKYLPIPYRRALDCMWNVVSRLLTHSTIIGY